MIAYLILAHYQPELLRRLVLRLKSPWARFFIHIDAKSDIAPFLSALEGISRVTLVSQRIPVYWGGWS
ncbi:MAG TPA: hypothetical protein VFT64_08605, partial [Rickettsiales bacterium]|nr:hypothetical protein [Rickettsiales bacterium]